MNDDLVQRLRQRRMLAAKSPVGAGWANSAVMCVTAEPDQDCAAAADEIERLRAAVSAERERCAKLCEEEAERWRGEQDISDFRICAARIRA